jgi:hypothetical protein
MSWCVDAPISPAYPEGEWFLLFTPGFSLYVPQTWTTTLSAGLLRALGIDPTQAQIWAEDADGAVWDREVVAYDPTTPLELDPSFRLYHITGASTGEAPTAEGCGAKGAFLETSTETAQSEAHAFHRPADSESKDMPPPTPSHERTARDFASVKHGLAWEFLKFNKKPSRKYVSKRQRSQWRKNCTRRFALTPDGQHLRYNAKDRSRKCPVRNANLTIHPWRIIPFEDEIPAVGPTPSHVHVGHQPTIG